MRKKFRLLSFPYIIWIAFSVITPLLLIAYYSVTDRQGLFTLIHFQEAFTPTYLQIFGRSLLVASVTTILCLLVGYPVALFINQSHAQNKMLLLFLFILPTWTNIVLRTYAWLILFYRDGLIERLLGSIGLNFNLQYSAFAVYLGMVYNFLPFMILPLYTSMSKIDPNLITASHDLGASKRQTLLQIILPLSMPGIVTGVIMVFLPAATTFVIPQLLGGGKYNLIGNTIERSFKEANNMNFGSALSIILLVVILLSLLLLNFFDKDKSEEKGGQ